MNQQFENGIINKKSGPGCLGRMVDLFDLSTGNRLLTDGSPLSRNQSDGGRISCFSDQLEHKVMSSDPKHSSSLNGTPMKLLIAQEMSKEIQESPQSSPNVVAKLMGLDTFPQEFLDTNSQRCRWRGHSRSLSGSSLTTTTWQQEQKDYKDIYEIWKQPQKGNSGREKTTHTSQHGESTVNEKNMALVRQKFMEAKQLATDEKLRQSKQFQDALDILSSNRDLFLKFLQEPNSLLAQHLRDLHLQSLPPSTTETKRITVLRPSKMVDSNKIAGLTKMSDKTTNMTAFTSEVLGWGKNDDNQPTRIIVLKPSTGHIGEQNPPKSEDESFAALSRDETSLSSAVSNGYIGDESSFGKSDNEYQNGKLSDSEIVSPTSRHSWDYINKFDSLHSSPSFSRASYHPGSSVCKEAKKRLSERWATVASTGTSEVQKLVQRNSTCTLGEMLAISDIKNPAESHEEGFSKGLEPRASTTLCNALESNEDDNIVDSRRNLLKSKSAPVSSSVFGGRLNTEVSKSGVVEKDGFKDDIEMKKLTRKLSLKEKVSSLFFSINKRTDKENPRSVQPSFKNGGNYLAHDHQVIKNQENLSNHLHGSESISLGRNCDASSSENPAHPRNTSDSQEQPSPISILEAPFVDHEAANLDSFEGKGARLAVHLDKCRLIDKSPPIGSISRVLSWESSCEETTASHELENTIHHSSKEEEEGEWLSFIQTLLSLAGLDNEVQLSSVFARCHSSESPLDLSLRDRFVDLNENELIMHETKRRTIRSTKKLVFDSVNAALVEIIPCNTQIDSLERLVDLVWACIKKWRSNEVVGSVSGDENGDKLVEVMVRKEVAGNGFIDFFGPLEIELFVKEMEEKLMEEVVREAVLELTGT
ncbi:uncharacterized protein LOC124929235 [Impatiens glandulifera]|uniref:uncharacterized protein LOC124929235 n=1 Tax=Impatiens glandulifera TaxID=253017 RepID=UPI001FB05729|nr:uncharacterized protein LOC124929235 [Impatiens glandulifera]